MPDPETPEPMQKTVVRQTEPDASVTVGIAGAGGTQPTLVQTMPVWQLIGIRAARAGLQTFLSALGIGGIGAVEALLNVPTVDFVLKVKLAALLALGTALASLGQNTLEFLNKLDVTHPGLRG